MFEEGEEGPVAAFSEREADVLRSLVSDYLALVETGRGVPDPVMKRLYPSASPEDERIASSFRDLVEDELTAIKRSNAEKALESLGASGGWEGSLSPEEQEAWVALLTDLRLVIGVRAGVTEETMEMKLDPSDPSHGSLFVLHYLGALQEDLVGAIQERLAQP